MLAKNSIEIDTSVLFRLSEYLFRRCVRYMCDNKSFWCLFTAEKDAHTNDIKSETNNKKKVFYYRKIHCM